MSTRMRWDKRRPQYRPWYDRDLNPFEREATNLARHGVLPSPKQAKPAKPKLPPIRTPLERPTVPAGVYSAKTVLRTSDCAEARAALVGAAWATVHTDGGASPNPGPGGFGVVVRSESLAVDLFGGEASSTNNRMELIAAISALEVLPKDCRVSIRSDSKYVVLGASQWIIGWRRKNWIRDGKPLPNGDLWRRLDALMGGRSIRWQWIKGHDGDRLNELADRLAVLGRTGGRA